MLRLTGRHLGRSTRITSGCQRVLGSRDVQDALRIFGPPRESSVIPRDTITECQCPGIIHPLPGKDPMARSLSNRDRPVVD